LGDKKYFVEVKKFLKNEIFRKIYQCFLFLVLVSINRKRRIGGYEKTESKQENKKFV